MYKSYPWYCMICNRAFLGGMGKASHYRGKKHKENFAEIQARVATKPKDGKKEE